MSGEAAGPLPQAHALSVPSIGSTPLVDPSQHARPLKDFGAHIDMLPSVNTSSSSATKRKREPSISSPNKSSNKVVKKAASTPTIHKNFINAANAVANASTDAKSPTGDADKKRNKLGYHRTSVACGHCRRRKIRCMMPDDNPSGRCSNCIRLKRECNFFPVEQSVPKPNVSRSASTSAHKGHISSASPSPGFLPSYASHEGFSFPAPHTYPLPSDPHFGSGSYHAPNGTVNELMPIYPSHGFDHSQTWPPQSYNDLPAISSAVSESYLSGQQRYYDSPVPVSPAHQPFSRPTSTFNPSALSVEQGNALSRQEITWSNQHPKPGNMAGNVGSLLAQSPQATSSRYSHSPIAGFATDRPDIRRASTMPHPPSLGTGDTSSTPSLAEPSGPLSAPGYSMHSPWGSTFGSGNDFNKPAANPREDYPAHDSIWYPDPINGYN